MAKHRVAFVVFESDTISCICYEAGPTGYGRHRQRLTGLGQFVTSSRQRRLRNVDGSKVNAIGE
jgi:hypothetical protein